MGWVHRCVGNHGLLEETFIIIDNILMLFFIIYNVLERES